jgi:hypothetical protein
MGIFKLKVYPEMNEEYPNQKYLSYLRCKICFIRLEKRMLKNTTTYFDKLLMDKNHRTLSKDLKSGGRTFKICLFE